MQADTSSHRFLEYGTHEGALYGTKLDTIRDVINSGYMAVLDVEPPVFPHFIFFNIDVIFIICSQTQSCFNNILFNDISVNNLVL